MAYTVLMTEQRGIFRLIENVSVHTVFRPGARAVSVTLQPPCSWSLLSKSEKTVYIKGSIWKDLKTSTVRCLKESIAKQKYIHIQLSEIFHHLLEAKEKLYDTVKPLSGLILPDNYITYYILSKATYICQLLQGQSPLEQLKARCLDQEHNGGTWE